MNKKETNRVGLISIRICKIGELFQHGKDLVPLDISGLIVIMDKEYPDEPKHYFIPIDRDFLKTLNAFNVFNILNMKKHKHIVEKIFEQRCYFFMGQRVYIEHIPKPEFIVKYSEQEYKLKLQP